VNKYLKILIVGGISIIGIYLAFMGEDFDGLIHQIKQVNISEITLGCFLLVTSCIIRAYRWKLIMDPVEKIPLHDVFSATMVGYFGNGILAFRLGELLRAYSVTSGRHMSATQAFGTVIMERILDLIMVLFVFVLLIPWFPFEHEGIWLAVYIFSGITFAIILGIFLSWKFNLMGKVGDVAVLQKGIGQKLFQALNKIFDGIVLIKKTDHVAGIVLSSILLWGFYYAVTFIILSACDLNLGIVGTGIILVLGSIVIGIPALPGSAGTYDAGIKFSLIVVFEIASEKALTYAIVSHAVSYFPMVIIGMIYFMEGSVQIKDVKKESITV